MLRATPGLLSRLLCVTQDCSESLVSTGDKSAGEMHVHERYSEDTRRSTVLPTSFLEPAFTWKGSCDETGVLRVSRTMLFLILCFLLSVEEGKLDTGEIPSHAGGYLTWIHRVLMAAYLLVTNVLLINLLIAIFRYSCNHDTNLTLKPLVG